MDHDGQVTEAEHHNSYIVYLTKEEEDNVVQFISAGGFMMFRGTIPRISPLEMNDSGCYGVRILSYYPMSKEEREGFIKELRRQIS